ncbi:hypothetical protein LTR51_000665 [Lithohypha guttulata]|nr:hypothetical protein LTR51_000665 [Lithohypha guttulata]
MSITGVCLLTPQAGNTSAYPKLLAHLSRHFPTQEHEHFHLDYRLFSDTTSQLPGADVQQRAFTHILTLSHDTKHAYVRSTKVGDPDQGSMITIPPSAADSFAGLVQTKMQSAWFPRQTSSVESGVSVSLLNDTVRLSIGDVKQSTRSQGAGTLRGTIIELCKVTNDEQKDWPTSSEEADQAANMLQDLLRQIFHGIEEDFGNVKFTVSPTLSIDHSSGYGKTSAPDWDMPKLYITVLRGQR